MSKTAATPQEVIDAILEIAEPLGRTPSRDEFTAHPAGMKVGQVLKHFPGGYNDAVRAAALAPNIGGKQSRIQDTDLWQEYGRVVRKLRQIPTKPRFDSDGQYSYSVYV